MFNSIVYYIIFSMTLFISALGFADENSKPLKIGILRHLTIEQAEQKKIDTQAEKMLVEAAKTRGHQIEFINPLQYVLSTSSCPDYDVIISRAEIDDPYEPITDSYLRALDYFETLGIPVINSEKATLDAQDKFRTLMMAQKAGIPFPLTFTVYSIQDIKNLVKNKAISYPFFIKNLYGGAGKGVFLIKDEQGLTSSIEKSFKKDEAILVEERIDLETDKSGNVKDMRTWVVRDSTTNKPKFIGGTYRTASAGHYLTNLYAGGQVSPMNPPYDPKLIEMSERSLDAIGADVAGIDIARDKKGDLYLIEINISFYAGKVFQNAIGVNIWDLVMDLAEARARNNKSKCQGVPTSSLK